MSHLAERLKIRRHRPLSRGTAFALEKGMLVASLLFMLACGFQTSAAETKLYSFEEDNKWGYKDASGQIVIKPQFKMANEFLPEGIGAVVDGQGWAYINKRGIVVVRPFLFDNGPDYFREGLARFQFKGKMGFFDRRGKVVIRPNVDFAYPFQEGLSAVCIGCKTRSVGEYSVVEGGTWGYINHEGRIAIAIQFDSASSFDKGSATVKLNGKSTVIDKAGHIVTAATAVPRSTVKAPLN